MTGWMRRMAAFFRREIVLTAAIVLALLSMVLVPPSFEYASYVDVDTLALLFSLMAVVKVLQKAGLFVTMGNWMLARAASRRKMLAVLVFLPFVSSMVITNDVALITFVPFALIVLRMAKQEQLVVPTVVMQTIAANLGSVLTPMGNPQNLYLYGCSGMGAGDFALLMLPYGLVAAAGLGLLIFLRRSGPVTPAAAYAQPLHGRTLLAGLAGFALCLAALFDLLPSWGVAVFLAMALLLADRKLLKAVDYSLLGTFVALFVLVGNIQHMPGFQAAVSAALEGHVQMAAILVSQLISNVPAALLLSGVTSEWDALIVGCNLGGLGTLIASMASLISYKMVVREYPDRSRRYLAVFTGYNVGFLAVLVMTSLLIP